MKTKTLFNPQSDLIYVKILADGPTGQKDAWLAVDTAASQTTLTPELVEMIGYSARDAIEITSVTSVVGKETGYRIVVRKFTVLGFEIEDYAINVHDLPDDCGFDGLLGLSFLRLLNYEVRSQEGIIYAERV